MIDYSRPNTIQYYEPATEEGHYPYYRYSCVTTNTRNGQTKWYRSIIKLSDEFLCEPANIIAELRQTGRFRYLTFRFESDNFYTDANISKELVLNPKPYFDPLAPKAIKKKKYYEAVAPRFLVTILETGKSFQAKSLQDISDKLESYGIIASHPQVRHLHKGKQNFLSSLIKLEKL